jgi:hypothetical protein
MPAFYGVGGVSLAVALAQMATPAFWLALLRQLICETLERLFGVLFGGGR